MSAADEVIARGDPEEILKMALGARFAAEEGRYCECDEPALTGWDLMCGNCLLENMGQRERLTARINDPHPFEPNRRERLQDHWCDICAMPPDDPRHLAASRTATGEDADAT